MNVALVYDRINKWGGAERVLLSLHQLYPDAPLFTLVYDPQKAPWAKVFTIKTSFLQQYPFAKGNHEYFGWITPMATERLTFDDFDVVISVSSADVKGIVTKPHTLHINYCLTPTRYLWSHYDQYFSNPLLKTVSYPVTHHLKQWDVVAAQRPDKMIAISTAVQQRIDKYYHRTSDLIYPPLPTSIASSSSKSTTFSNINYPYYLVVSRLVSYKRVDLAIDTCKALGLRLVVVGSGMQKNKLQKRAQSGNVQFLSKISDDELSWLYANAEALIVPQEEDFGLVMLEAHAHNTAVIAYGRGGALDIVTPGITGELFQSQTVESLTTTLLKYDKNCYKVSSFKKNIAKFSDKEFKNNFHAYIKAAYKNHIAK